MKKIYTIVSAGMLFAAATFNVQRTVAQVVSYTDDTLGAMNMIDPNATATPLNRVNGSSRPTAICMNGFSSKGFNTTGSFADTFRAVEVDVTPNSGHTLNVTGFTADLRRSNTGPVSARYAYSTDGGTTWTDQGADETPMHAGCDTLTTIPWTTTLTVPAPGSLMFRVYGYGASASTGTFQIKNLSVLGSVTGPVSVPEVTNNLSEVSVVPNPMSGAGFLRYSLVGKSDVTLIVVNELGQKVQMTDLAQQAPGVHSISLSLPATGIYFVTLKNGDEYKTLRVEKY